ncbi:MAG: glycosyltransferase family 2 protein [Candidatus Omnitrophica bacterium]|nr:glycosyltransferase family 2 protein [Candidatus Omnitrophota bacterium]
MGYKVSAYIPCYNNGVTVLETIRSLRAQTYPVDEIFLVDDGSKDDSLDKVKSTGVRLVCHSVNLGRGVVRSEAMKQAKNELVLSCDANKFLRNYFVEKALLWFKDEKVAAVFGSFVPSPSSEVIRRWFFRHLSQKTGIQVQKHKALLVTGGAIVRKTAVINSGNYDPSLHYSEDADLGKRLLECGYNVIFDPCLENIASRKDGLSQVLMRHLRWCGEKNREVNFRWYVRQIYHSFKVMAVRDIKAGDFMCMLISLLSPHYQFWFSWRKKHIYI